MKKWTKYPGFVYKLEKIAWLPTIMSDGQCLWLKKYQAFYHLEKDRWIAFYLSKIKITNNQNNLTPPSLY